MQKENIPYDFSQTPYLSSPSPSPISYYSHLFQNHSPINSPCESASFYDDDDDETKRRLHDFTSILEYQQLYNRYNLCLSELKNSIDEVDDLRRTNDSLRLSNADLSHRVALLISRDQLLSEFNRLTVASPPITPAPRAAHVTADTPSPLSELNRIDRRSTERVSLPKSISVRSTGYLKMNRPGTESTSQPSPTSLEQQRVYVPGAKTEEEALELEVYNQGMFKTELCNKWQDTGACPYGENCQFAHGIKELRPVIRHPRYKTEVCRMLLAGDNCPYGHRCHFRHALTEQERLMASPR